MSRMPATRGVAWLAAFLAFAVLATTFGGGAVLLSAGSAQAQEQRPRTLFQLLFPNRRQEAAPEKRTRTKRTKPRAAKRAPSSAPATVTEAAPDPTEKQENARTILVVGDFLAGGLAEGLEDVYRGDPAVRIVDRSNGSSGFVRNDFYDWPGQIGPIIDEVKPTVVAVMLGSNDRQVMRIGSATENVRSERWDTEYEARATYFASQIAAREIPIVWVGLPSFRFSKMSSDMIAFNDMQRNAAETAGGVFIDVWDGFVDENGAFVTNGPDINGQPVRLRASDGINFTAAGKRKIAFYAEKPLARILQSGPAAIEPGEGIGQVFGPQMPGAAPVIRQTLPVSLADPALDGGEELMGRVVEPRRDNALTPAQKLVIEGIAPDPRPGRVDDFTPTRVSAPAAVAARETTSSVSEALPETGPDN